MIWKNRWMLGLTAVATKSICEATKTEAGRGWDMHILARRCGTSLEVHRLGRGRGWRLSRGGMCWRVVNEGVLTERGSSRRPMRR